MEGGEEDEHSAWSDAADGLQHSGHLVLEGQKERERLRRNEMRSAYLEKARSSEQGNRWRAIQLRNNGACTHFCAERPGIWVHRTCALCCWSVLHAACLAGITHLEVNGCRLGKAGIEREGHGETPPRNHTCPQLQRACGGRGCRGGRKGGRYREGGV